ncbi:MAG: hypothetical protein M1818_001410 [Claussenomyces sp. TS43310]|nr:MAG: hypothetical protein M1818_001410 [Claussenomyces sp. TS43310]
MAQVGARDNNLAVVPDSPAVKRQKTVGGGYHSTSNSTGYDSASDSGDELFEGVITTPVSKHLTQPTQIIDRGNPDASPKTAGPAEVQIPASSPFRPAQAQPAQSPHPPRIVPAGGRVASIMAPAGTTFRTPHGVVRPPMAKPKPRPITISDEEDDGPKYKGGSSDDDGRAGLNIRPSSFVAKTKSSSFGSTGTGSAASKAPAGPSRFSAIMQDSVFTGLPKDPGRLTNDAVGKNTHTQTKPARALPVEPDMTLYNEQSFVMQRKIARLRQINPQGWSVHKCRDALIAKKGDVDAAAEMLASPVIDISDDEVETPRKQTETLKLPPEPQMKAQLKAPIKSIQERYSSSQHPKKPAVGVVEAPATIPAKPERKRRLMKGRREPSSPMAMAESPKPAKPQMVHSDREDYDSGVASASEEDPELEGRVLNFMNTCSVDALADLASIKPALAETMISQRPFKNLHAARNVSDATTLKSGKKSSKAPIGERIVQTATDMWSGYEAVDSLVARCEELGKPLAVEMGNWGFDVFGAQKSGELEMTSFDDESDSTKDSAIGTPSSKATSTNGDAAEDDIKSARKRKNFLQKPTLMSEDITLKDYQLVGLNWLALLYKHNLSCILADDMGLGKTCQVIAFLSHLVGTGVSGPHLVIVPPSTLENWLREFQTFSPNLVVEPYYGSQNERAEAAERLLEQRGEINVVVSTYDFATKPVDNKFMRRLRPETCTYDEGHVLKNPKSLKYKALMKIPAAFRLLLTGTPLQNNLMELAALLAFILPDIFRAKADELDFIFKHKATTRDADHAALLSSQRIGRARSMLTPFVLRRKKDQVLKHMPAKRGRVEYCEMHPSQIAIYDGFRAKAQERARLRLEGAKVPNDGENNPLMQLRKAAIHPMLFRRHFTEDKLVKMLPLLKRYEPTEFSQPDDKILQEMRNFSDYYLHYWCTLYPCIERFDVPDLAWMDSGKVDVLVQLLKRYKANGDRVLVFSQFTLVLDILESVLQTALIQYMRFDGTTKVNERQTLIDNFRDDTSITTFLLSTGAGGTGINLMFANKVIIFDSSFNPQDDIQAENRAHRVGQTKEVEVVRLVTKGTIEEQIYALGQSKLTLDNKVAGDEDISMKGQDMVAKLLLRDETALEDKDVRLGKDAN